MARGGEVVTVVTEKVASRVVSTLLQFMFVHDATLNLITCAQKIYFR